MHLGERLQEIGLELLEYGDISKWGDAVVSVSKLAAVMDGDYDTSAFEHLEDAGIFGTNKEIPSTSQTNYGWWCDYRQSSTQEFSDESVIQLSKINGRHILNTSRNAWEYTPASDFSLEAEVDGSKLACTAKFEEYDSMGKLLVNSSYSESGNSWEAYKTGPAMYMNWITDEYGNTYQDAVTRTGKDGATEYHFYNPVTMADLGWMSEQQIYSDFGYGENVVRDPSSLSYVAEPLPGLVVLGIDSNEDEENRLVSRGDDSNVSHVAGRIKPATLQWLLERAREATRANKQVIALLHHHLVSHFDKEETLVSPYVLENAASVQRQLLEAGVRFVLTGHFHVQDVARVFNDEHTDSLTEVSSGALVGYPHPFRTVDFNSDFTQAHLHSGFIRSIASMPDLESQSQAVLSSCVPSLVRTLVSLYWDRLLNKLSDKLGGLDNVRLIMDLPETPAEAAALVNEYLGDAARRSYMLLTEGNEHLKRTDDLMNDINTGLDGMINALVKPLFRTAVSGLLRVELDQRFGTVFTSVYHDVNNVGTPGECEVNDLYLDLELPRPTAIERVVNDGASTRSVDYYDITGHRMSEPGQGVNIVVTQFTDGTTQVIKTVN